MFDIDAVMAAKHKFLDGDEVHSDHGVFCPHCDFFHDVGDGDFCLTEGLFDGGDWEMECEFCQGKIEVETQVSFTWIAKKPVTEEDE